MPSTPLSKPSTAAHSIPRSHDQVSEYSLDLEALNDGEESNHLLSPPGRQIERIYSDAVDGPSDFTLNMDKWMKHSLRPMLHTVNPVEQPEEKMLDLRESALHKDHTTSTLRTDVVSHYTPQRSPPRASLGDNGVPVYRAWHTIDERAAIPVLDDHRQSRESENERRTYELGTRLVGLETPATTIPETQDIGTQDLYSEDMALESRLQELSNRYQNIERLNSILTKAIETEQLNRGKDQIAYERKLKEAESREQSLMAANEKITERLVGFQEDLKVQRQRLYEMEKRHASGQEGLQRLIETHLLEHDKPDQKRPTETHHNQGPLEAQSRSGGAKTKRIHRSLDYRRNPDGYTKETNAHQRSQESAATEMKLNETPFKTNFDRAISSELSASHSPAIQRDTHAGTVLKCHEDKSLKTSQAWQHQVDDLTAALSHTKTQLVTIRSQLELASRQNDILREQVIDHESINALFDKRISQEILKRDQRWRSRISSLGQEREVMSRALMHVWGNSEIGPGNPQKYKYKRFSHDEVLRTPGIAKTHTKRSEIGR